MADLSNTSPWIGAGQGITAGIQNAGVIQGLIQHRNEQAREERLAPLREKALMAQGAKSELELKELQEANTPVNFDVISAPHQGADPVGVNYVKTIAQQNGWLDPSGNILQKHLMKARELSMQPQAVKERALLNVDVIDKQIMALPPNDPNRAQLLAKKTHLLKLNGMLENPRLKAVGNGQGGWNWIDENTKEFVPELKGMIPQEAQIAAMKPVTPEWQQSPRPDGTFEWVNLNAPRTTPPATGLVADSSGSLTMGQTETPRNIPAPTPAGVLSNARGELTLAETKRHNAEMEAQGRIRLAKEKGTPVALRRKEFNEDRQARGLAPFNYEQYQRYESKLFGPLGKMGFDQGSDTGKKSYSDYE
jgi:hypothetical protein